MHKPLVYISHGSAHHSGHSGYTRLLNYIDHENISGESSPIPYRIRKRIATLVSRNILLYDSKSVAKEFSLIQYMMKHDNGIAHFLNGERDIRFSNMFKKTNHWATVASFHEPPSVIARQLKSSKYIQQLDGAIAVGLSQLEYLHTSIGGGAIEYIPHGIDTTFFTPDENASPSDYAVMIGVHYRAFECIDPFVSAITSQYPNFKLKVVIGKAYRNKIPDHSCIEVYSGVSDEILRELYRNARFLFLPLSDVTACNAILEALACGTPVITTDLESNRDYIHASCGFLIANNNIDDFVDAAGVLIKDYQQGMRKTARAQSLQFSWEKIAAKMSHYYQSHF